MSFGGEALSADRVAATVDASVEYGFSAVSANDHFVFQTPWLDGPTVLASVIERSAGLDLATTASLATLRGPVALAKQLAAIDILSGGRLAATLGPGRPRATTPARFQTAQSRLCELLEANGRPSTHFPNALATMWTWIGEPAEAKRVLTEVLAPLLRRPPDELQTQVCVGSAEHCAELLHAYAEAGCDRVYLWPIGDERTQLERISA